MPSSVRLPSVVKRAIRAHARRERPQECCGLLVGVGNRVHFAVPMRNVAASATRFRIDDEAHIDLRRVLRGFQPPLQIVGVYHSHPQGAARPSSTDVDEAMYPEWVYVIVGLEGSRAVVRAYQIRHGAVRSVTIR